MSNAPLGAPIVLVHGIFGFGQPEVAGLVLRITSGLYRMPCVRKAMWSPNRMHGGASAGVTITHPPAYRYGRHGIAKWPDRFQVTENRGERPLA